MDNHDMYQVGFPGWKWAAKLGVPVRLRIHIHHDIEANCYWATSPDLDGLVVQGHTLDELQNEAMSAADTLLDLALNEKAHKAQAKFIWDQMLPA